MTKTASSRPPSRKASRRSKLRRLRSEKTADLRFGPGASAGFSAAGIAAFDDLRPAAVVRELLQNSLDAAHSAGVAKSVVRFRLDSAPLDGIPGIASYRKAFHAAVDRQRDSGSNELPGQARLIAGRIEQALECDHLDILSIMDNGVGLDERRMNALLSDGVSAKDDQSTGSYGNGHFTAVPASDLRYILYGGVTEDGSRVAAGHAVLASHHVDGETHLRGADGFLIRGFNAGTNSLYDYATGQNLPQVIDRDLKCVEAEHGHGTTVIITAFNNFLEESWSLWEMVCQAASANFFIAIEKGRLEVTVEDGRSDRNPMRQTLNRSNLSDIIEKYREQRLSKAFLSGSRAFDAWQAYCLGDRHVITTKAGEIEIHIRENPAGSTRIDLCRNGMWITDDRRSRNSSGIPGFSGKFTDRVPFQAVLSLNAQDGNELHELIRMAEGPLHESISLKRLPSADQKRCRGALNEIRAWILEHTSPIASDPYTPDDFLALDFGDDNGIGGGKSRKASWGTPVPVNQRPVRQPILSSQSGGEETEPGKPDPKHPGKGKPPNANRNRSRPSLPVIFQAVSRSIGKYRRRIVIDCLGYYSDAEMRLMADEAIDATCDRPNQDTYTPATLSNVKINGTPVSDENLRTLDNRIVGVCLGNLVKGATIEIETDYHLSGDFANLPDSALRIELFKSLPEKEVGPKSGRGVEESTP